MHLKNMNRRSFLNVLGTGSVSTAMRSALLSSPAASAADTPRGVAAAKAISSSRRISITEYQDRVHGSWLGGIAGTLFGMPFEGKPSNVVPNLDHLLRDLSYAPVDDDYYYEMVALFGFERHGLNMTVEQLGEMWHEQALGGPANRRGCCSTGESKRRTPDTRVTTVGSIPSAHSFPPTCTA